MFGWARKRATEHTTAAIRPLLGIYQRYTGLPAGFWDDEYVLGFIGFLISFHASVTSGERLSQEDKGQLMADVFTSLSNLNGQAIGQKFTKLSTENPKNAAFELGADNAAACAFVTIGKVNDVGRPHFEKAKAIAAKSGSDRDISVVSGLMFQDLFVEQTRMRFENKN